MRRREKQITDQGALEQILWQGQMCQLAIPDEPYPYLVPMNYGYAKGALYFHSAGQGRKIELLQRQQRAAFSIIVDPELVKAEEACHWGSRFRSVAGHGHIEFVEEPSAKVSALKLLMAQYSDDEFTFPADVVTATTVFRLIIDEMTGKQSRI